MTTVEQRRACVVTKVMAGELTAAEAGGLLGLSERSVCRLKGRFIAAGPAGLVHGNRGRASPRRIDEPTPERVRALAAGGTTAPTTVTCPNCSPSARGSRSAGSACGGSCGRPASPPRAATDRRATAAAGTGRPRRACSSRPTARATTGSRSAARA